MTDIDTALSRLKQIASEADPSNVTIVSEEDTKIQLITRILVEALCWPHRCISAERKHENGYSDYVITDREQPSILLEAKRAGTLRISTANQELHRILKLNGPSLKNCLDGIHQAAGYASPHGIPIAVLTDGTAWIVFKPHVPGEYFLDKEAFVFPTLSALIADFHILWDLISRPSIQNKHYTALFDKIHNPRILLARPLVSPFSESDINRQLKGEISFDLESVFDSFFSRMQGDEDPDLLIECFVETRESRIADFSLEKMTKQVLGNISPEHQDVDQQLSHLIGRAVEQDGGISVFIVGPTGSGKTTFLDRFFRKTLSPKIRQQVIPLRLNFLDSSGSHENVQKWMTEQLIEAIEGHSFTGGNPTWEQLQGLYFNEYQRRSRGVDAVLYRRDHERFREKFGEYMAHQVEDDREGYLRRLLSDLVLNRKKMPLIVVDNTDEFDLELKKAIFQYAQALRRHTKHCMVIQPVTDKSAWSFSRTDLFAIYSTKSFFLPTPPPREVFRKRIEYIRRQISNRSDSRSTRRYLSQRGIQVSIGNLERFATELEHQFVNHERTAKLLGEIANYNIRVTLNLARRVMTSAQFRIEDILAARAIGGRRGTRWSQFMNALLKGDHDMYREGDIPEVVNVFQVDGEVRQSPLLRIRILTLLQATANAARDVEGKHLSAGSIHSYFEAWGCTEAAIDRALGWLVDNRLVEKFDPSVGGLSRDQRLAITHAGRAHLRLALDEDVYFEQMGLTTGLAKEVVAEDIREEFRRSGKYQDRMARVRRAFAGYLVDLDSEEMKQPVQGEQYSGQEDIGRSVERHRKLEQPREEDAHRGPLDNVVATVDWFSLRKGYGFAECSGIDGQIFLHKDVLTEDSMLSVRDGDDLVCSVGFTERGPQITKVKSIHTREIDVAVKNCKVVRLFHDRGYGFVRPVDSISEGVDAFFHFSLLEDDVRERIVEGDELEVEIKNDLRGRGLQVRKIIGVKSGRGV